MNSASAARDERSGRRCIEIKGFRRHSPPLKRPVVFLSHGAPTIALEDSSDRRAWRQLATELPRPAAILVISAHWDTHAPAVSATPAPETIHDFFGFPRALDQLCY